MPHISQDKISPLTADLLLTNNIMKKHSLATIGIGREKPTFIIAEAGINHNGDLKTAMKMVDAAKKAGANAIKFQTYITDLRVKRDNPVFNILKECELSHTDLRKIKKYCDAKKIIFFSTPFDEISVRFLVELRVPLMKVASFDIVNHRLLKAMAATRIPAIISRGMASKKEIDAALRIFKREKCEFALLHCVSAYPTPNEKVNLHAIETLRNAYAVTVGYSDHTLGLDACLYAVASGARVLEKHFTLNRTMKGPDQAMSANPSDLTALVMKVREVETMMGSGNLAMSDVEKPARVFRRPSRA